MCIDCIPSQLKIERERKKWINQFRRWIEKLVRNKIKFVAETKSNNKNKKKKKRIVFIEKWIYLFSLRKLIKLLDQKNKERKNKTFRCVLFKSKSKKSISRTAASASCKLWQFYLVESRELFFTAITSF